MRLIRHVAVALGLMVTPGIARAVPHVAVSARGAELSITVDSPPAGSSALRLDSDGLRNVELGRDTGEPGVIYLPPRTGPIDLSAPSVEPVPPAENVFFFNDVADEEWRLVLRFAPEVRGSWKLNGRFSPLGGSLAPEIEIPVGALEIGENLLHITGNDLRPPELYYRRRLSGAGPVIVHLAHEAVCFSGRVALESDSAPARVLAECRVASMAPPYRTPAFRVADWSNRVEITAAARAVARNVLAARITNPRSMFAGGFNLVYDIGHRSSRMPHWIWAWGPTISLLLDLAEIDGVAGTAEAVQFRQAALAAARRSLNFGVEDKTHPAFGVSTVRWEPSRATPDGWVEYMSTSDSLFLSAWGWMRAYAATGERPFLEHTERLVAAADRLMRQYPVVPQDWVVQRERWTPHTLDESLFGLAGIRRWHEATNRPEAVAIGRRYVESHLRHMALPGGFLKRAWLRDEDREIWEPDVKGHAWVVEGYLDAYRLIGDARYLSLARELGDRVVAVQGANGGWVYAFKRPAANDDIDDKGTAIWAYFMYELHRLTGDAKYLECGRRALRWCLEHQAQSADLRIDGGIVNVNSMAYVRRRPMSILYSNTFFGLALLEELKTSR